MSRRKERVPMVKPRTSLWPTDPPLCLKLIVVVAWNLSSFEALDQAIAWSSSSFEALDWSLSSPSPCSLSPPPLDLVATTSRSTPIDRISISFSIYLSLSLSLSLFLPPSLSFTEFESLTIGFILIFVSLSLYIEIFYYKICLEVEKMWEKCRKIAFSECYQTPENIFQCNF